TAGKLATNHSRERAEEPVEQTGEQGGGGEGEDPAGGDVANGGEAQSAAVGGHGAGYAGAEHMGSGDGKAPGVGGEDGGHGHQLGAGALRVGKMLLADSLAHGDHNTLPAHHGPQSQRQGNGH